MARSKKDKKATWWTFGLLASIVYLKRRINSVGVVLQNLGFISMDSATRTASLMLTLGVKFPLPFGLRFKRIKGNLYIMGKRVAEFNHVVDRYIESDKITTISLPIVVHYDELANGVLANIQTGNIQTLLIQLEADISTTLLPVYIRKTLTYNELV